MDYLPYIWGLFGIVLMAAEFLIPGFVIFFAGLGAVATGVATGVIPGLGDRILLQILIWLASSSLSLAFLRRTFAAWFRGTNIEPGDSSDVVGQTARVVESIGPGKPGRVRFHGTTWRAETFDESFDIGDEVMVFQKENLTLTVGTPLLDHGTGLDDE